MAKITQLFSIGTFILVIGQAPSITAQSSLNAEQRINGKLVREAFEPQRQILQHTSAVIYTDEKSHVMSIYGTIVSAEGHILTKASEIDQAKHLSLRIDSELYTDVEILATDPQWDVALLKINPVEPLTPIVIGDSENHHQGSWVISNGSTTRFIRNVRIGIVSAITREIKSESSKVILGIQLGTKKEDALEIMNVTAKSGAARAGVKKGDVLKSADNIPLNERSDLLKAMKGKKPGDTMEIELLRRGKKVKCNVELMARPGKARMTRNDQMSGGTYSLSERRDGFPRIIHHDTPLIKKRVGGPLLNLQGECIGMNIARASRVATYAIPARELREIISNMIK